MDTGVYVAERGGERRWGEGDGGKRERERGGGREGVERERERRSGEGGGGERENEKK